MGRQSAPAGAHTCAVVASVDMCEHADIGTVDIRRGDPLTCGHMCGVGVMGKGEPGRGSDLGSTLNADT